MKRWLLVPAIAAALALVGLAYWGYGLSADKKRLTTAINTRNQMSFYELLDHVQNMEVMLSKGMVSNSPKQKMLIFADIWQQAYAGQGNLSQLPISGPSLTRTSKFLTQAGDFTWTLAKKYARGLALKPDEVKKLNQLHTEAGYLAVELQNIEKSAADGIMTWGEIKGATNRNLSKNAPTVPMGLQKIDKHMEEFPTLIYDGPFSDHILQRKPKGLTGGKIDADRAAGIARSFVEAGSAKKYRITKTESVNGTIPAFRIHMAPRNAAAPVVIADISKTGGHILQVLNTRAVNSAKISRDRAVSIASGFLAGRKIKNMEPTYIIDQQNTGVVIFEYKQDNVIIYPDLMKVKIALDNGEVVGFEGTGFVMNHQTRKLSKPRVSERKALSAVNPQLKVKSKRLAVIPLETLQEVLTYEFRGDMNGDNFIVYINAMTGEEERIIKVIDTNSGPVTM